jgi:glycosyltransferase involved in cell wall biosynthesis
VRIGINARRLEGQPLGVARYIEYLLEHWTRLLAADECATLYLREPLPAGRLPDDERYVARVLRPKLSGVAWENTRLPLGIRDVDVFFGPSYSLPLTYRGRTVVAIHSVNEVQAGAHSWSYRFTYAPVFRASARKADRVIVPSQAVRRDLQEAYGIHEERIAVIGQGVDDDFGPVVDEDVLRQTRIEQLGDDRPYVVFVGKLSQRRNIPMLIRAFAELVKEDGGIPHTLLLFGPNHLGLPIAELVGDLGVEGRVIQSNGVVERHHDLTRIYSAADAYVSASAYEGFSMTAVEAMACGVPVVGVNRAAFGEIVDEAGLLVDEPSVEGLREALRTVLSDARLRGDLSRRGIERARSFRWEELAGDTLEVLREVARS